MSHLFVEITNNKRDKEDTRYAAKKTRTLPETQTKQSGYIFFSICLWFFN